MYWEVRFTPTFRKNLESLDKGTQDRVIDKIEWLAKSREIRVPLVKYLPKELDGLRKYRVGNWRILLWLNEDEKAIVLYGVGHRKEIYKRF